jgi:hypothetical protein
MGAARGSPYEPDPDLLADAQRLDGRPRTNTDNGGNCPEMSGATVSDHHCARAGRRLLAWMFRRRLPMMGGEEGKQRNGIRVVRVGS